MKKEKKEMLTIAAMDLEEINQAIDVLKVKLVPYLQEVTVEEKKQLAKMSDKSFAFVTKTFEHSEHHPDLVPSYIDKEVLKNHIDVMETFRQLNAPLRELMKGLEDTLTLIGSDAYTSALTIYAAIKTASKNNVPGAQVVYEDLKVRFQNNGVRTGSEDSHEAA